MMVEVDHHIHQRPAANFPNATTPPRVARTHAITTPPANRRRRAARTPRSPAPAGRTGPRARSPPASPPERGALEKNGPPTRGGPFRVPRSPEARPPRGDPPVARTEVVGHAERLLHPLKRTNPKGADDPGWQRITWDEALDTVAARLSTLAREHGPESVMFSTTSPSTSAIGDALDWVMRLRRAFGSPNQSVYMELCGWGR